MRREDFLYQYLLIYNEYEKKFNGNAVNYWKNDYKANKTSGLVFMVLRNALVHNTLETINNLEQISPLSEVLENLKMCKLKEDEIIRYMDIFFQNKKVLADLKIKGYELINTNKNGIFKLLQKKDGSFYRTIFFSHTDFLFNFSVSTYNQKMMTSEYYQDYYIETEFNEDNYILRICKHAPSIIIKYHLEIYIYKNFNTNKFYESINHINIVKTFYSGEENIERKIDNKDIANLGHQGIKELFDTSASSSLVKEVIEIIKNSYNDINNILHIIGFQTNV